jgi:hypothetical protein
MVEQSVLKITNNLLSQQETRNIWNNKKYGIIKKLEKDLIGKLGEELIVDIFNSIDKNCAKRIEADRGPVDVVIYNKKCEVKTATFSLAQSFTNDFIMLDGEFDIFISLGLAPENIYVSIYNKNKIPKNIKRSGFTNRKKVVQIIFHLERNIIK